MKNKIGWCDMTWNPVWGCNNHCEYCYARGIGKRFYNVIADKEYKYMYHRNEICTGEFANRLRHFVPTFINSQFNKELPKKPQRIFVGSMSEIYYWKTEWREKVREKIKQYPQHTFQFLTKFRVVYNAWSFPENCWLGITTTREDDLNLGLPFLMVTDKRIQFLSIEPILEKINPKLFDEITRIDWIIIGAETGNRKDRVIPKREWIDDIVLYCKDKYIPIYLKDSLKEIYPIEIKEFPYLKGVRTNV